MDVRRRAAERRVAEASVERRRGTQRGASAAIASSCAAVSRSSSTRHTTADARAFGASAPLTAVATFVTEDLERRGVTFQGPMMLKLPFPPFTKSAGVF